MSEFQRSIVNIDAFWLSRLGNPLSGLGGWVRDTQNWIGASAYTPVGASFVPAPPEEVVPLLDDLMAYVNRSDVPPLVQAGIAHAQFETIHPFADGNGHTGRALIHTILRGRGPGRVRDTTAVADRVCDCRALGAVCRHFEVEALADRGPDRGYRGPDVSL